MGTYSVSQVEKLTGVRSHTLRMWERRYQFLTSNRTATNIRAYTDDQVKKILNITILLRNGYRLAKLDKLTHDEIMDLVINILDANSPHGEDDIQGLIMAMIDMDEVRFNYIFENNLTNNGVLYTITDLIFPFMQYVGSLWRTDRVAPVNEHFVSHLIRRKLLSIIDNMPIPTLGARKLLLFLPEGEDHDLGLIVADYIARERGWKTYYLGQNIPSENIQEVIDKVVPDVMFSMMIIPRLFDQDKLLRATIENASIPWLCSGNKEVISSFSNQIKYLTTPQELIDYLDAMSSS